MGIYRDMLESLNLVERQDGEVWKTSAGTWAGKRDGKTQYGLSGKEKAQAYVAGKDVKGEEEPSEKEPKKEKHLNKGYEHLKFHKNPEKS